MKKNEPLSGEYLKDKKIADDVLGDRIIEDKVIEDKVIEDKVIMDRLKEEESKDKHADRRRDILNAALKVFSEQGFEGAKIEEIARVAGIGKGTVYEYFESKKQLFQEMVKYSASYYTENLVKVFEDGETVREKLISFSRFHTRFLINHLDMLHSALHRNVVSKEMRTWMMEQNLCVLNVLKALLAQGIQTGEIRSDLNIEAATFCILGPIVQYGGKMVVVDRLKPDEIDHEVIVEMILRGLQK